MDKCDKRAESMHILKLLQPKKDHRVCSKHFIGGCPSTEYPVPEVNLGFAPKRPVDWAIQARQERSDKRAQCTPMSPSHKNKGSHGTQSELCSPDTKFIIYHFQ